MKMNMNKWILAAYVLMVVGALNWGLVGFFGFDLVEWISMGSNVFARIVYSLVGISGLIGAFKLFNK